MLEDFGLARLVDHGTGPQTTGLVQGTVGYIDPEFVSTFQRSTQSDVYSFGIVLLEIVSGRQPVNRLEPSFRLPKWVWSLYSQDLTLEAADTRLSTRDDDASERQMERALVVGLCCRHSRRRCTGRWHHRASLWARAVSLAAPYPVVSSLPRQPPE
jgi:serine/threonine protein kinase